VGQGHEHQSRVFQHLPEKERIEEGKRKEGEGRKYLYTLS